MDLYILWNQYYNDDILDFAKCATVNLNKSFNTIECAKNGHYLYMKRKDNGYLNICELGFHAG